MFGARGRSVRSEGNDGEGQAPRPREWSAATDLSRRPFGRTLAGPAQADTAETESHSLPKQRNATLKRMTVAKPGPQGDRAFDLPDRRPAGLPGGAQIVLARRRGSVRLYCVRRSPGMARVTVSAGPWGGEIRSEDRPVSRTQRAAGRYGQPAFLGSDLAFIPCGRPRRIPNLSRSARAAQVPA